MDFIALDISILCLTLIITTIIFSFFIFSSAIRRNRDYAEELAVIDLVRNLKKVCPVDFSNKWKLIPLNSGLSRCWTKKVQFPGFLDNITLYGTTCAVTCSSMYAFSLIADVTRYGEWEPLLSPLLLKPFLDSKFQSDSFMQADQVVGIQRGTDVQSYVAMYRFLSFPEKTVKWVFLWNAKKLEFMFFLIQPAVSKTVNSQCLITHIFGSKHSPSLQSSFVAQRLRNIKDFLVLSQLNIISSKYTPARPLVLTKCSGKPDFPEKLYKIKSPIQSSASSDIQHVFMLIPITQHLTLFSSLKGSRLVVKKVDPPLLTKQEKKQVKKLSPKLAKEHKGKLKRSVSDVGIHPTIHRNAQFRSSLQLHSRLSDNGQEKKNHQETSVMCKNSIIVEENFKIEYDEENGHSESPQKNHSLSESDIQNSGKHKSLSYLDCSDIHTDEETYVNLHIIHEDVPQENLPSTDLYNNSEILCSSTSEFELVDTNQQFLDCKLADFLTQGNFGASVLQAEMMLASQFDISEEPNLSGWTYHSTTKGITVLAKTTSGQFMKILSFLCQIELPVAAKDIWKCVKNPRFRFFCDETSKTVKIIERISDSQKLIHVYHETSGIIRKEGIDFCLLQTEREESNHFYSVFHSIEYERCPFMTSVLRGSLKPSGWIVESLGAKCSKVTHMMQILVSSPDSLYIQELSSLVPLAMHNLKHYTASKPN